MKAFLIAILLLACVLKTATAQTALNKKQAKMPTFQRGVINSTVQYSSHKPKVLGKFSKDPYNDIGSMDKEGFKLYRYSEGWKQYLIFTPGDPQGFEDAQVADINHDGWNDIIIGGWSNMVIWAENPEGHGQDPYTTKWKLYTVDNKRFSHEVCTADLNNDDKPDIITTSGVYIQGSDPSKWTFVDIGRSGQGTFAANVLSKKGGYSDVIALYRDGNKNQVAWFENPGHKSGDPLTGKWIPHIIDANPGGDLCNVEMTTMAFTADDINGDGRIDLVCASQGEGPDAGNDNRQIGDGLVWYEAPANPRSDKWIKHTIDKSVGWVHASSIKLADFDGDGHLDVNYAQQDQSKDRKDGSTVKQQLGIFYNIKGNGLSWHQQVLSQYPTYAAGGFNSKVGLIGKDKLPSIFTALHGYFHDPNPLMLWRHK